MGVRSFLAGLVFISCISGLPVPTFASEEEQAQVEPTWIEPSSKWVLDYGESRCRIGRTFGESDEQALFYIEQRQPSAAYDWVLAGGAINGVRPRETITVNLGARGEPDEIQSRGMKLGELGDAIRGVATTGPEPESEAGLPRIDPRAGKEIDSISISSDQIPSTVYAIGNLEQPFLALNQCTESLVEYWGLDLEQQRTRAKAPVWKNFSRTARKIQRKYPADALRNREHGIIQYRVMVSAEGEVTDCELSEVTEADRLLASGRVCWIMLEGAEFDPATDSSGNAIPSYLIGKIRYIAPG